MIATESSKTAGSSPVLRCVWQALLLGLLLGASPAWADSAPLWEMRGEANRIYLLGSMHFLRPGRDALPAAVISAYQDADALIMELDLDDLDPVASAGLLQQLGTDPEGRSLQELLGGSDYQEAVDRARAIGIDIGLLQTFEPWLAAITISQLKLQMLGFDASAGVEQQLAVLAARDGKEIRGLETLQEQLAAMDALPPKAQRTFLLETLDEAADIDGRIDDMVTAWRQADLRAMERQFLDGTQQQPELYRRIVVERNRNWARQFADLARERRNLLVVVGTLHLVGPDSLIGMLEDAGFEPQPLR
ncbi:MAG: TraB/GumN family protein [Gammaproteobacteria bacterium]|nr:TraB/GumN family protein [Gammaproteobacteria bacterium]